MHVPKHFAETRTTVLHDVIRANPFAALITTGEAGIEADHLPLVLAADPQPFGTLRGHLARANPVWRGLTPEADALVLFQGPHGYVSPDWYPSKHEHGRAVPTWNYAVVHARGTLRVIEDADWLHAHVSTLTRQQEQARATPWAVSDAPEEYLSKMTRAIVGIEIRIHELTGKWKLSQNRPRADRQGVVDGLEREGQTADGALAALVRGAMDGR